MNMVTTIAYKNMKYHKSRNILTGIAILLTTLLLFIVPTVGKNMVDAQFAVVNEIYPRWHALFREVDGETAAKLAAHHAVAVSGLRSDVGYWANIDAEAAMLYVDENGLSLYNIQLEEGRLPESENEIVVSKNLLRAAGLQGDIGETIQVSYQISKDGGLDYVKEKEFVICGFCADTGEEQTVFSSFISREFLEEEIPGDQIRYRFLFQAEGEENATTEEIKEVINNLAGQFHIKEQAIYINREYLAANYVDPAMLPIIAGIMLIIVIAGIITIYSIYYVGMAERVREYGKLKAIGATDRQLRQMVLREGFCVAAVAVPLGLLIGTVLTKTVFLIFLGSVSSDANIMALTMRRLLQEGRLSLYHGWIYLLAAAVGFATVYVSLCKPMKMAAKISEVEAMRQQAAQSQGKKKRDMLRKSYRDLSIVKLARIYLTSNKKNSAITIVSMGATGVLFMVIATVLSCANPKESADYSIMGQYELSNHVAFGDKEHPEYEWSNIVQSNPLNDAMKQRLETVEGVTEVVPISMCYAESDCIGGDCEGIAGIPEKWRKELLAGIKEGSVTYEELQTGEKMIVHRNLLQWYPDIKVGDVIELSLLDGSGKSVMVEVAAIGDYPYSFSWGYFMMAQSGVENISGGNCTYAYSVFTEKEQEAAVGEEITSLVTSYGGAINLRSWQQEYETWKSALAITSSASYALFAVLGLICIMNMINTMINNVHLRKKEIGMMQAIGMSDRQLIQWLQREGLFYTAGTLLLAIGGGSALGYPVFLWARNQGMFNISRYHYPLAAAAVLVVVLFVIQMVLALLLGHSVRKVSLIERVKFAE